MKPPHTTLHYPWGILEGRIKNFSVYQSNGFSLIELLVVIMIMALMFGLATASYRDFGRRQMLTGAVRQIKGDLRYVQENALAGRKPGGACAVAGARLQGYVVRPLNTTTYQSFAICAGTEVVVSTYDISARYPDVTVTFSGPITFRNLGKGVDNAATITVNMPPEPPRTITITTGGEIN